jgi:undecaprenyl-diphosphatase
LAEEYDRRTHILGTAVNQDQHKAGTMLDIDIFIIRLLNKFVGKNAIFDDIVYRISSANILKGVIIATMLWWCWTRHGGRLVDEKAKWAKSCIGILLAITLGRTLQLVLPFRHRPLHDSNYLFSFPSVVDPERLSEWSSLPSDHAVMFFASATAIWSYSHSVGAFAFVWVAVVICLPRVYIGFHYPTDILTGAAVGVAIMAAALRITVPESLRSIIMKAQSHYPGWLYAGAFFLTFQLATLFDDIRALIARVAKLILAV